MRDALATPWSLAAVRPMLPPQAAGPVAATAAPLGVGFAQGVPLETPWAAADVRLPARAMLHPWHTAGAPVPAPRPEGDAVIDPREFPAVRA